MRRLKKRAQFRNAAKGGRASRNGLSLQAIGVDDDEPGLGFTVTKRAGNAVERNRIKRRLRAAADACGQRFQSRHDYVLLGRREVLRAPFASLVVTLDGLVTRLHSKSQSPGRT